MATDGTTLINPIGLSLTLAMGLLMVILPRRYALVPVIILVCFMTMRQRIIVAGLDFTMLRILALFGWIRLFVRQEVHLLKLNAIDKALLWWVLSSMIAYTLLWQTFDAFINRLGFAYNAVGMYFLFRLLVTRFDDVVRVFKILAIFVVPLAVSMLFEMTTGRNAFGIFGAVNPITQVRDGVLRCQGPFAHPILAGTFGATTLPLFVALWWQGGANRLLAVLGVVSSTIITLTAGSSGPLFSYLAGILGLSLWPLRKHMRAMRWGLALMLVALHIVMKAPVWALIGRVNVFSGSTGYHRAYLIDRAIANLGDWWLIGTQSSAKWGYGLNDVTNQYFREGVNGGLLAMFLFISIIAFCFRGVGRAIRVLDGENNSRRDQLCLWAMGAALLSHVVTFMGVSYFDQNFVVWMMLLAMIATSTGLFLLAKRPQYATNFQLHPRPEVHRGLSLGVGRFGHSFKRESSFPHRDWRGLTD